MKYKRPYLPNGRSSKNRSFIMMRDDIYDSPAFQDLDVYARSAFWAIRRRYRGHNNGDISWSCRELGIHLNCSKDKAAKALGDLIKNGFIAVTEDSNFNYKMQKARRFRITSEKDNGYPATNDWQKWSP